MKNQIAKVVLWFSVFTLAFELPVINLAGQGLKLWMLSALAAGLILLWDIFKSGFTKLRQSKILLFGIGFIFFSLLGLINSPQPGYSLKQVLILTALIILGIFFETQRSKKTIVVYSALASGLLISALAALYQNIAFEYGWPHFEVMAARPNGFFPEADWLGMYLALGLAPFLVAISDNKRTKFPKILRNKYVLYLFVLLLITALIITVARASWLTLLAEMGLIILLSTYSIVVIPAKAGIQKKLTGSRLKAGMTKMSSLLNTMLVFFSLILISLLLVNTFHLSRFNIPDRFRSIFFQEHIITVAENPSTRENIKIDLEEMEKYRAEGYTIKENYITDENVVSRGEKAAGAWDIIKQHPVLGSGLGATLIATNYAHNANNLFLEWWASAGLGGLALILGLILYLLAKGHHRLKDNPREAVLIIAGAIGFVIVNLFNASIFLAFAWFYLAWLSGKQEAGSKK